MKKFLVLVMSLMMLFTFSSVAFGLETIVDNDLAQEKAENIIDTKNMMEADFYTNSYTDEKGSLVIEETKVYTGESGWEIEETTQFIIEPNNNIVPFASGNVTKNVTHEIKRYGTKVYRIYIWGKFQYNGSKATVVDASWNTRILDSSVYEEQAPYGGSGTNTLGTAQIWVNYNLGDRDGTWKGDVKLECNKKGN